MKRQFDEKQLSAYLDGEMTQERMDRVEEIIRQNRDAQQYILQNAMTTARLKQAMGSVLSEAGTDEVESEQNPLPENVVTRKWFGQSWFQLAAAVLIFFIGTGAGLFYEGKPAKPGFQMSVSAIPAEYQQSINHALEYEKSGKVYNSQLEDLQLTVTPIRTYKHKNGKYFREYRLEVMAYENRHQIKGLAYRSGPGEWSTTALFFSNPGNAETI